MIKTKTITERFDEKGRLYERQTEETLDIDGDGYYNGHIDEFDTEECREDDCCKCDVEGMPCPPCSTTGNEGAYRIGVYKPECITIPLTDNIKLIPTGAREMSTIRYIEINDTLRLIVENGKIVDWYEPLLNRVLD